MNVDIGTEAAQFLLWKNMGLSLQCNHRPGTSQKKDEATNDSALIRINGPITKQYEML
jgi:hypothetical protein